MPTLSVTEKSHWRDRIAARIDRLIEATRARDPARFDRIARQARDRAIASLGLAEPHAELEAIRGDEVALARRRRHAQRSMIATLRSVPPDEVPEPFVLRFGDDLGLPREAAEAIARRQTAHHDELLAADEAGREIVRLEAEKERLLDTVWLAVSPAQIKQLWAKVGELLGDEPTRLEREALAIAPAEVD